MLVVNGIVLFYEELGTDSRGTGENGAVIYYGNHQSFRKAVQDLTAGACEERNQYIKDAAGVYYQSVGSKCNHAVSGRFPLNFTYYLVKYFGGENDGLVSTESFLWGEDYWLVRRESEGQL